MSINWSRTLLVAKLTVPAAALLVASFATDRSSSSAFLNATFPFFVAAFTLAMSALLHFSARWLGKATAWALLTLVVAAAFMALYRFGGGCPAAQSCTAREAIDWAVVGASIPAAVLAVALLTKTMRLYASGGLWVWAKTGLPMPAKVRGLQHRLRTAPRTPVSRQRPSPVPHAARETTPAAPPSSGPRTRAAHRSGNPAVRAAARRETSSRH